MSKDEGDLPPTVRKAKHEYYRSIFDKYDADGSGQIELKELTEMLKSDDEVPRNIVKHVFDASDTNQDGKINYDEFMGMVHNRNFKELFGHYVDLYIHHILPPQHRHTLAYDGGTLDERDGLFEDHYSCWPPPIAMIIFSAIECACFFTDVLTVSQEKGPIATELIYDPYRRSEFWRFLTYMFVHVGYTHLVVNLSVQLLLGIFLEMVHKWWRVVPVYLLGVIAGSLATSITDPTCYLAGASGGVYAILTAHIASIILNWREMTFPFIQLAIFFVITFVDIGMAVYSRYWVAEDRIGYAAHFAGGVSGLLVGIWALKNFVPTRKETYVWWISLVVYVSLMGIMIVLNIVWKDHFYH